MVRPTVALLVAALAVGVLAAPVEAQPSPYGAGSSEPEPKTKAEQAREDAWREAAEYEQRTGLKQPERLLERPSGFWTSTRPAKGGAYRWRIMAMGAAALAITIFFVYRLLRRTSSARA